MRRFAALGLAAVLTAAFGWGCATVTGETAGEYTDDSVIHAKVDGIIIQDEDAQYFKIGVTVTLGEVVLTGFAPSKATEDRLIARIREVRGVKSVKSLLQIGK